MRIRPMSDIHLEFADYTVPPLPHDKETVLVLAGDIGLVHKSNLRELYIPFLSQVSEQFLAVVLIVGNHEHYGGSFRRTHGILRTAIEEASLTNVYLQEKDTTVIGNVAFVCATLWTDCDRQSPFAAYLFSGMSDSRVIRTGPNDTLPYERKFSAQASWTDHLHASRFIFSEIPKQKEQGRKVVVVTHHAPSYQSIAKQYAGSNMNMFYASALDQQVIDSAPELWVHGHTHHHFDYMIETTRVIANPRGYQDPRNAEDSDFDERLVIEL